MSNITLQLDSEALRQATVQAMTGTLTPEVKNRLISDALDRLLAPSKNSWEKGKSPVEQIFEQAFYDEARKEVNRMLSEDEEFKTKICCLLREVADKVIDTDREEMATRMAGAFCESIRRG